MVKKDRKDDDSDASARGVLSWLCGLVVSWECLFLVGKLWEREDLGRHLYGETSDRSLRRDTIHGSIGKKRNRSS